MNNKSIKKSLPTLSFLFVFSVVMVVAIYSLLTPERKLPIFNPADVNPKLLMKALNMLGGIIK